MEPVEYRQLVANIKTDGVTTSTPLVCEHPDGTLEIISGHHRTKATIDAGLEKLDVIVILDQIPEDRKRALQLSHNSIKGKDNPALLAQLFSGLDLDAKKFAFLTEDDLGEFGDIKIDGIGAVAPKFEPVTLLFLPADREILETALSELKTGKSAPRVHAAAIESFTLFFDALVKTKETVNVSNSALALVTMAELAMERLAQIEQERANQPPDTPNGKAPAKKPDKRKH